MSSLFNSDAVNELTTYFVSRPEKSLRVFVADIKNNGINGGTFTSGSYQTRTLNTIIIDEIGSVVLAANRFLLPAGTYWIDASAPALRVNLHKTQLYNITDASIVSNVYGTSEKTYGGADDGNRSFLKGRFTISSSKQFEVRHRCSTTKATDGFGRACSFGDSEVYTIVEILKIG